MIQGQLELLARRRDPAAAEVRRVERVVQTEIARVTRLVDDMLLLARSEQPEFLRLEAIELVPFVQQLWRDQALLSERRYELGPLPAGTLTADPDRLAQALRNLLANAVGHTAAGEGLVRMHARAVSGRHLCRCAPALRTAPRALGRCRLVSSAASARVAQPVPKTPRR